MRRIYRLHTDQVIQACTLTPAPRNLLNTASAMSLASGCMSLLLTRKAPYYFPLTLTSYLAITQKGRQYFFMPEILAPCLELFRGFAHLLAKLNQSISETVRVEIWLSICCWRVPLSASYLNSLLRSPADAAQLPFRKYPTAACMAPLSRFALRNIGAPVILRGCISFSLMIYKNKLMVRWYLGLS